MQKTYTANGKLLLTGEYLVLQGAEALVLPLKYGQQLRVSQNSSSKTVHWVAIENHKIWFEALLETDTFNVLQSTDKKAASFLIKLFKAIKKEKPNLFSSGGYVFTTHLNFNRMFGWGSSSTLIHLLAQWADINPYVLHFKVSSGSGYDIAAASSSSPFLYKVKQQQASTEEVDLQLPFSSNLYFVYLGKKQDTQNEVRTFLEGGKASASSINKISEISRQLVSCKTLIEFTTLLSEHEIIIAKELGRPRIANTQFREFDGFVKSLGAWGGDFVLLASPNGGHYITNYLNKQAFSTYFNYNDLVLQNSKAKTAGYAGI